MTAAAHGLALALVAVDLLARSIRVRSLFAVLELPLRWWDAFRMNAWADLAAVVTPMRLGGEAARLAALRLFRVPAGPALAGLALEVVVATPTTLLIGALLVWLYGRSWLSATGGTYVRGMLWVWLGTAVLGGAVAAWWQRRGRRFTAPVRISRHRALGTILMVATTTTISVLSRAAILLVLVRRIPGVVVGGTMLLESFALLFGQMFLPIPAGTGVVDAAFLHGTAGPAGMRLLLVWRAYTVGLGALTGLLLLVPPLWQARSRRLGAQVAAPDDLGIVGQQAVQHRIPLSRQRRGAGPLGQLPAEAEVGE